MYWAHTHTHTHTWVLVFVPLTCTIIYIFVLSSSSLLPFDLMISYTSMYTRLSSSLSSLDTHYRVHFWTIILFTLWCLILFVGFGSLALKIILWGSMGMSHRSYWLGLSSRYHAPYIRWLQHPYPKWYMRLIIRAH